MKRIFLLMAVAICANFAARAEAKLSRNIIENDSVLIQQVDVVATRATKTTPIA